MNPTHAVLLAHVHLVHLVHMAAMGLLVSLVAPGLATVAALFPALDRLAPPARVARRATRPLEAGRCGPVVIRAGVASQRRPPPCGNGGSDHPGPDTW